LVNYITEEFEDKPGFLPAAKYGMLKPAQSDRGLLSFMQLRELMGLFFNVE
jgi:hypothetical protein